MENEQSKEQPPMCKVCGWLVKTILLLFNSNFHTIDSVGSHQVETVSTMSQSLKLNMVQTELIELESILMTIWVDNIVMWRRADCIFKQIAYNSYIVYY